MLTLRHSDMNFEAGYTCKYNFQDCVNNKHLFLEVSIVLLKCRWLFWLSLVFEFSFCRQPIWLFSFFWKDPWVTLFSGYFAMKTMGNKNKSLYGTAEQLFSFSSIKSWCKAIYKWWKYFTQQEGLKVSTDAWNAYSKSNAFSKYALSLFGGK